MDEYDKPILDNIDKLDIALTIRDGLKNFYSVIKDCDRYLRFIFLTGVSKFSKVNLFSGLNNLKNITLDSRYAAICGYAEDEIRNIFSDYLPVINFKSMRQWYDGFNFPGDVNLYNPYKLKDIFHAFFASIPHDWYRKNQIAGYEGYYASIFYCYFTALGLDVTTGANQ